MTEFTQFLELELLDHVFRNSAYTSPTSVHLALHTTTNTDTTPGTAVTGGGYARQAITFGVAAAPGIIENTVAVTFTATGSAYSAPVVATSIYDASTAGNQLCHDNDFTDTTVNQDDTLSFAIGAIDVTLD